MFLLLGVFLGGGCFCFLVLFGLVVVVVVVVVVIVCVCLCGVYIFYFRGDISIPGLDSGIRDGEHLLQI